MNRPASPLPMRAGATGLMHEAIEIAIVVPTLNEAGNIDRFLATLADAMIDHSWEVIFVDDNSSDGTGDRLRAIARLDRRVRVIERIGRRGLASACIEGMMTTAAPVVAVTDADLQHDLRILPAMLAAYQAGECDVVVGSRYVDGGGVGEWDRKRHRESQMATRLARRLTGVELADPMSGFFLLGADRVRALVPHLSGIGFKILLDILATSPDPLRVREIPYTFNLREEGESKLDRVVAFEYLVALYDQTLGHIVPTRFALFGTIGGAGVAVHFMVLASLFKLAGVGFDIAQAAATLVAMSFNFFLNNALTYREKRLKGFRDLLYGWLRFGATCAIGAVANVAVAAWLKDELGVWWVFAALAGIVIGSVWNFALSSKFVWGRY